MDLSGQCPPKCLLFTLVPLFLILFLGICTRRKRRSNDEHVDEWLVPLDVLLATGTSVEVAPQ